jgi:predicted Zn finger-like uncharacterized protein
MSGQGREILYTGSSWEKEMPERMRCRHCEARFMVKDSLLGKKIRCPECQEINQAPPQRAEEEDDETGVVSARPPQARATSRPRRDDEDEEDDIPRRQKPRQEDLDEERPKRKRRKQPAHRPGPSPILIFGGGILVVLHIVGLVVWIIVGSSKSANAPVGQNPPPAGNPQGAAVAFNEKIVAANKRLEAAGQQFGQALQTCLAQEGRNTQPVRVQYQNTQNVVNAIRGEMTAWPVPNNAAAKNLQQGYQRFLQSQDEGVKTIGQVVTVLENGALTPAQKNQQIKQLLGTLDAAEQTKLAELQNLQREFARENNIILRP